MRRALIVTVLFLCFCNGLAMANPTSAQAVGQGNHGYIYGTQPKVGNTATTASTTDFGPISAIWKLDAWIRRNLW